MGILNIRTTFLTLLFIIPIALCSRDFYQILGVPRSAQEKDIKKAFKRMSMKWHPDKNPGDEEAAKKY